MTLKKKKRATTSAELRTKLNNASCSVKTERRIYISFPRSDEHTAHTLGVVSFLWVLKRLVFG